LRNFFVKVLKFLDLNILDFCDSLSHTFLSFLHRSVKAE